jgi:hypothetical protein
MHRRNAAFATNAVLGNAMTIDRRANPERRQMARRRTDIRTIAQYARTIGAGETRLEVIVDGAEGMRLVAMFDCGCSATEPVGNGKPVVRTDPCSTHREPRVPRDRRLS